MLIPVLVVLVAVVVWIAFKPAWLPKPPENQVTHVITTSVMTASDTARDAGNAASHRLSRLTGALTRRAEPGKRLKAWAAEADLAQAAALYKGLPEDAAHLTAWLQDLPDEQAAQLAHELDGFCQSLNLKLDWLYNPADAEMKAALKEVVGLYALAAWKGRQLQPFAAFQAWQMDPDKGDNRAFGQKLYRKLAEANLVSAPADLVLASDQQRQAHVVKSIRAAAAQNRSTVLALVAEIRVEREAPSASKPQPEPKATEPETGGLDAVEVAA